MLVESGYDLDQIAEVLERDGGVDAFIPGRAERISGDRGPLVYIDYGTAPTRSCRRSARSAGSRRAG
jgi:UDP-N-acetylmuramoyl-L-alanyl-D-glutamate--2,6-diaminopimelate ligase